MELHTASAIVGFYDALEETTASFYEILAEREAFADCRDVLLAFAKENKKHRALVLRVYREVITDAIEAGFSFAGLTTQECRLCTEGAEDLTYSEGLQRALEIEENAYNFCIEVSQRSRALLADIAYVFERVAKRKLHRRQKLQTMFEATR